MWYTAHTYTISSFLQHHLLILERPLKASFVPRLRVSSQSPTTQAGRCMLVVARGMVVVMLLAMKSGSTASWYTFEKRRHRDVSGVSMHVGTSPQRNRRRQGRAKGRSTEQGACFSCFYCILLTSPFGVCIMQCAISPSSCLPPRFFSFRQFL